MTGVLLRKRTPGSAALAQFNRLILVRTANHARRAVYTSPHLVPLPRRGCVVKTLRRELQKQNASDLLSPLRDALVSYP